ncbi:MAG: hypothetical protein PWP52_392 [Bacteroidales bacterium]|nr:hypothetical protein [Bacteroidales bacterium]
MNKIFTFLNLFFKVKNRLWGEIVTRTHNTPLYPYIYKSYWHSFLFLKKGEVVANNNACYFAARPNPGAGIGHQMANWNAGYWFAKQFGLKFAHIPFAQTKWENFLGFGNDEVKVDALRKQGYKKVLLPLFDENKPEEIVLIQRIIDSYRQKNVVFIAEQDQFYHDQYGVMEDIKQKFYTTSSRKADRLIYNNTYFNIAIHVRRGDISISQKNKNPNLVMRWQDNKYFEEVLTNVLLTIKIDKPIAIYLFSQGERGDFTGFEKFDNIHFCLDMGAQDSFLHLIYADLLITSKSSFSYKPALLNNGIKVCPRNFWHGYPKTKDWILADEKGQFEIEKLRNL